MGRGNLLVCDLWQLYTSVSAVPVSRAATFCGCSAMVRSWWRSRTLGAHGHMGPSHGCCNGIR